MKYLIMLIISSSVFASDPCGSYQIKFRHNKKMKLKTLEGCYYKKNHQFLSRSCFKNRNCKANKKHPLKKLSGSVGNPLFHHCYNSGGTPQIANIKIKKEWKKMSFCYFDDDSVIDLDQLFYNSQN